MSKYEFVDTIGNSTGTTSSLPTEAICYAGVWLDREVPGFTTLQVSGRELLSRTITARQIGHKNGEQYQYSRYEPRVLKVKYSLRASSNLEFREAFNLLSKLLKAEEAEIVFNDEPDKYFVGTSSEIEEPTPGTNDVIGTFHITCSDPRKYSKILREFKPTVNTRGELEVTVNNSGSGNAILDYNIVMNSAASAIGIVSDQGVMQFGTPANYQPTSSDSDVDTLVTMADLMHCTRVTDKSKDGMPSHRSYPHDILNLVWKEDNDYGWPYSIQLLNPGDAVNDTSGNSSIGMWELTLPADRNGDSSGAKDFYCSLNHVFAMAQAGKTGELSIGFLDNSGNLICGYTFFSVDATNMSGCCEFWLNGKVIKSIGFKPSLAISDNEVCPSSGCNDIKKEGAKVTFYYYGKYYSYTSAAIKNSKVKKIQISMGQMTWWGSHLTAEEIQSGKTAATKTQEQFVDYCKLRNLRFDKLNVSYASSTNKLAAGAKLTIDGQSGKFFIDGMEKPGFRCIGSTYFTIPPGPTKIKILVPAGASRPTVKVYERETWL